ncbi:MAG: N-6 DNA methylase, partial [Ignavibacteria bacterium]|nr:N-6 DNA methylase [Ignavibacteria bacterium]
MQGNELRKLEAELWRAADQLRANSKLTATEYSMPVLGLIFLRHAYNRFLRVKDEVEKNLPVHPRRGRREINQKDFEAKNAMFLPEISRFDYLVNLPEETNLGDAINEAMKAIEEINPKLSGILPKNYTIFSKSLLKELLRIFNKEVLQKAEGDIFGKIYEYFLNKFAMTGAQEGGDFFTPFSLVNTIVNIIEPNQGIVFDPACGSAGMFVQTGYFIESEGMKPAEKVTFYGQEKAETNTKLSKMNLAVHGLEGDILEGNTFYEDKHKLVGKCDFVMANPPFNVDGVDKSKDIVKKDKRLPFGLPKNDNANYLWIQYFYSYLKPKGRAGFVMASSASDAGHSEKDIRKKLVKTGAVDVMVAIGNNFFYTRSLPCTLWFFDRTKETDVKRKNQVLMLDARKIFRKVTQKINDFSPEQLRNIISIVNLYRSNPDKFKETFKSYIDTILNSAKEIVINLDKFTELESELKRKLNNFVKDKSEVFGKEKLDLLITFDEENQLKEQISKFTAGAKTIKSDLKILESIANNSKSLRKSLDKYIKGISDGISTTVKELKLNKDKNWKELNIKEELNSINKLQEILSGNPVQEEQGLLNDVDYYYRQAHWLKTRFP